MFTYLIINVLTISFPLIRSFENKIAFAKKWQFLFPAIFITGIFFIIWDHLFTEAGVWHFNDQYIIGWYILSLPLEEWLFFLTIPFACVFIYEVVKYFIKTDPLVKISPTIIACLLVLLITIALWNTDKLYTSITCGLTALFLALHWAVFKSRHFGYFLVAYMIHLVPFLIVNGLLTSLPVVLYNDLENLGIRIYTIPVEDSIYSFLLLLMNISIYEFLIEKKKEKKLFHQFEKAK